MRNLLVANTDGGLLQRPLFMFATSHRQTFPDLASIHSKRDDAGHNPRGPYSSVHSGIGSLPKNASIPPSVSRAIMFSAMVFPV